MNNIDIELLRKVKFEDVSVPLPVGIPKFSASNNWAVSPARSVTNRSLYAGDPHLNILQLPPVWYEMIGYLPDNYIYAATFAGNKKRGNRYKRNRNAWVYYGEK